MYVTYSRVSQKYDNKYECIIWCKLLKVCLNNELGHKRVRSYYIKLQIHLFFLAVKVTSLNKTKVFSYNRFKAFINKIVKLFINTYTIKTLFDVVKSCFTWLRLKLGRHFK